ncbi:MAG: dihydroorotate dehydrogenase [Thermodesulfobacteriota bacterium]
MSAETGTRIGMDVTLGSLRIPNPVMNASGTAGYGTEGLPYLEPEALGAFVTKGISVEPRTGNPPPRIAETPAGMLNAIGLENVGIAGFVREHLPVLRERHVRVIVNFFAETEGGYVEAARRLSEVEGIAALEMNVSCPNVKRGGRAFGRDPVLLHRLVRSVRNSTPLPLFVKLTPDAVDIVEAAEASWEAGADAVTVCNTYMGMAVDVEKRRPRLSTGSGGLSGPAIRPLSLYRAWLVARRSPVPVIAAGGIVSAQDALEYLIAGACAVQIGTGSFVNPALFSEVTDGIRDYLIRHGHADLREVIGSLQGMPDRTG